MGRDKSKKADEEMLAKNDAKSEQTTQDNQEMSEEETPSQEVSVEEEMQQKYDELNDKYLRLYSEFDNFRRRTAKERIELITNAGEGLIKDLLPVLDDFERAIEHNENAEDPAAIKEGFQLIYNKFVKILEGKGLKAMDSKGKPFDTELHDAVANFPVEDKKQKEHVIEVAEKGYLLNDKVIRHAKVIVGQ